VLRAIRVHRSWLNQDEIEIGLFLRVMPRQNEESLLSRSCGGKLTAAIAG